MKRMVFEGKPVIVHDYLGGITYLDLNTHPYCFALWIAEQLGLSRKDREVAYLGKVRITIEPVEEEQQ